MFTFTPGIRKVHFIGIGGISMSGLAEILLKEGFSISGSDRSASGLTEHLASLSVPIAIGHSAANIPADTDLVVYTAAIKGDNPELQAALARGIQTIDRATLLGALMRRYDVSIAVAGTHGKTTTTGMITQILLHAGKDPSLSFGGILPSIHSNVRHGKSPYFVMEACEYCDSFLQFYPHIAVILNIEADHLDYFEDYAQIQRSFRRFAENIDHDGLLVINGQTPGLGFITGGLKPQVITYDGPAADWQAADVSYDSQGRPSFTALHKGTAMGRVTLSVLGLHNVSNALAAIAVTSALGLSFIEIRQGLASFTGTARRFETKGRVREVTIVDDYAHHPTEIRATLAAAKNAGYGRVVCVFQPHTYTRTQALLPELAQAFANADETIIVDIYAAREPDNGLIHAKDLAEAIGQTGASVRYLPSFAAAEKFFWQTSIPNDLWITMGAGDVYLIGESILRTGLSTLSTDF